MENINLDEMKIPEHCSQGGEISEGFGKKELIRASLFIVVGLLIGIIIKVIFTRDITVLILTPVMGGACGYIFCKKDRYSRRSVIDMIIDFRKYKKSQKFYEYRR